MPIQQGMNQMTAAAINTIRRGVKSTSGVARRASGRRRRKSSAGSRSSGLRKFRVTAKRVKLPKFGGAAWRKKYGLGKKRRRKA
jgi:hypothetical protein